jgi:hypothetical protein
MKIRTLIATTVIIAGATVSTATAQTTTPKPMVRKDPLTGKPVPAKPKPRSSAVANRLTRDMPPPPPPTGVGTRARRPSTTRGRSSTFNSDGLVTDPTGRKDLAGRAVPFYPTARGAKPGSSRQASAQKSQAPAKTRENGQKDPFKSPEP